MTTPANANDTGEQAPDYHPQPAPDYHPQPTPDCDPGALDDLKCTAKGIAAQAAYNAAHLEALDTARTQYEAARKAYSTARDTAAPLVREAKKQLDKLIEQLDCLIDDPAVVDKLNRAFGRVEEKLEACGDLSDIERRTKEAEDCFADLIQEPTKLTERVTNLQAEIADIATKTGGNPESTDFRRLYAAALVARRHRAAVWRGFPDVNAYMDCICQVLTCMLRGHTAIAELKRRDAVHTCHRESKAEDCERLRSNTVDEVIAEYLKISAAYADKDDGESDRYGDPERDRGEADHERQGDRDDEREQYRSQGDRYQDEDRKQYRGPDDRYRGSDDERDRYLNRAREPETPPR
jgi:hypothetical protein